MKRNPGGKGKGRRWCILRTSPGRTINLARSLAEVGLEAWTPARADERKRGRSRVRYKVYVPILPTFVFVPADHIRPILHIVADPVSPHPQFSIFRTGDTIWLVTDEELKALRDYEERERTSEKRKERFHFERGDAVRVEQSAFTGLTGIVESCDGRWAMVNLGFATGAIKVEAWQLVADELRAQ